MDDERDDGLSIRDLAELAGTTVRTIHYYIAEGLLPPPQGIKRNASYTGAHLARLRLIAALREEGLALSAIRARLAPLTDEQALTVVATLDEHLAAGDRTITILGLIEAALTREAAGGTYDYDLEDVSFDRAPKELREDSMQSMPMSAPNAGAPQHQIPPRPAQGLFARRAMQSPASAAPESSSDSASDYLGRLLRRPPGNRPLPRPAPMPMPKPRPMPDPYNSLRPETWHHFEIADGVELRVRDDRYREGRGQLRAVIDSLRPILQRYGLTQHRTDDSDTT